MTTDELNLISGLFDRLTPLTQQPRDPEAESLIRSKVAEQPLAPYFLTQSTLVLQQAVTAAQSRIAALEKQLAEARAVQQPQTGFLSGVASFLGGTPAPAPRSAPPLPVQPAPLPAQYAQPVPAGGGFFQNALATAAGVAGGAMLFQGIEGLMGHGGGSGFGGGGMSGAQPEIVNNYYGETPDASVGAMGGDDGSGLAENDQDSGLADAGADDSFDFGGDDS